MYQGKKSPTINAFLEYINNCFFLVYDPVGQVTINKKTKLFYLCFKTNAATLDPALIERGRKWGAVKFIKAFEA